MWRNDVPHPFKRVVRSGLLRMGSTRNCAAHALFLPSCCSSFLLDSDGKTRVRPTKILLLMVLAALLIAAAASAGATGTDPRSLILASLTQMQISLTALVLTAYRQQPALVLALSAMLVLPFVALLSLAARLAVRLASRLFAQTKAPGRNPEWTRDSRPRANVPAWPAAAWLRLEGDREARAVPLKADVISIGRHEDNVLHLEHASVHRFHAVIHRNDDAHFVITDLSGVDGNGVRINGERFARAPLTDGDRIELGEARLTFAAVPH